MKHKHHFLSAGEVNKKIAFPAGASLSSIEARAIKGTVYVCIEPNCGATLHVYVDGTSEVMKEGIVE